MTTLSISSRLAIAAAAVLLLAAAPNAEAKGGDARMALGAVSTGTNQPGLSLVAYKRDHRDGVNIPKRAGVPSNNGFPIIRDPSQ